MTHVQRAVGERRAVMQRKARLPLVLFQQFVVEVKLVPMRQHIWLTHRQSAPHREAGLAHIERLFVFHVEFSFEQ